MLITCSESSSSPASTTGSGWVGLVTKATRIKPHGIVVPCVREGVLPKIQSAKGWCGPGRVGFPGDFNGLDAPKSRHFKPQVKPQDPQDHRQLDKQKNLK